MKFLLIFFFMTFAAAASEKTNLSSHFVYEETNINYNDDEYSCNLILSDKLLQERYGMQGERGDSVARKRYKIIYSLEDRLEILASLMNYRNFNNTDSSKDQKCLFAILMRDYAISKNNRYKFFGPKFTGGHFSGEASLQGERLLDEIFKSKLFSEKHLIKILDRNLEVEFLGMETLKSILAFEDRDLKKFLLLNLLSLKNQIKILPKQDNVQMLLALSQRKENDKEILELVNPISYTDLKNSLITDYQKASVLSYALQNVNPELMWSVFSNCLLGRDDSFSYSCFDENIFNKLFQVKSASLTDKCTLIKEALSLYSPTSLGDSDERRIESFFLLPLDCAKKNLESMNFFRRTSDQFQDHWCKEYFQKETCSKFYTGQWFEKARICKVDQDCQVSAAENQVLSHNFSLPDKQLDLYFKTIAPNEKVNRNINPGYPAKCIREQCSIFKSCDLRKNYEKAYQSYVNSQQCRKKEDCGIGQLQNYTFPLAVKDSNVMIVLQNGKKIYWLFSSFLEELVDENIHCSDEKAKTDFGIFLKKLQNADVDCINNKCVFNSIDFNSKK